MLSMHKDVLPAASNFPYTLQYYLPQFLLLVLLANPLQVENVVFTQSYFYQLPQHTHTHIYIYIYKYAHIHTYIYIHRHTCRRGPWRPPLNPRVWGPLRLISTPKIWGSLRLPKPRGLRAAFMAPIGKYNHHLCLCILIR